MKNKATSKKYTPPANGTTSGPATSDPSPSGSLVDVSSPTPASGSPAVPGGRIVVTSAFSANGARRVDFRGAVHTPLATHQYCAIGNGLAHGVRRSILRCGRCDDPLPLVRSAIRASDHYHGRIRDVGGLPAIRTPAAAAGDWSLDPGQRNWQSHVLRHRRVSKVVRPIRRGRWCCGRRRRLPALATRLAGASFWLPVCLRMRVRMSTYCARAPGSLLSQADCRKTVLNLHHGHRTEGVSDHPCRHFPHQRCSGTSQASH